MRGAGGMGLGPAPGAAKGLEKYGFEYWVCVTLFKDHGHDEQRYFSFYSILAPFITRTLPVCLFS